MSADDHLNPFQFPRMAVSQLKRLPSVEGGRVGDHIPRKLGDVTETQSYAGEHWDSVRAAIRNGTIDPVHVDVKRGQDDSDPMRYKQPIMGDGLHRVALADQMGVTHLPVSNHHHDAMENDHGGSNRWRMARHFGEHE